MKTVEIRVVTEEGGELAVYRGISQELAERVVRFLDFTLGSAKVVGDIKRNVETVIAALDPPRRRGRGL